MSRRTIGRGVGTALVLLHFLVLFAANLPWSPIFERLLFLYSGYVNATGQRQSWMLYTIVNRASPELTFEATYADGVKESPWGPASAMAARRLYFLETMLVRGGTDDYARRFLERLRRLAPEARKPVEARVAHYLFLQSIPWAERSPAAHTLPTKEIVQRW